MVKAKPYSKVDLPYGVMTSAMPFLSLEESIGLISGIGGIQEVELSAVDSGGLRAKDKSDHVASHLPVYDFVEKPKETALRFAELFNKNELGVTLGNYDRIHSGNFREEKRVLDYMLKVIDFAAALGGRNGGAFGVNVGMFWGWDRKHGIERNLNDVADKVYILARYAEERNVKITTENCHMPGGWPHKNEMALPQQVMRSAGSTLAGRLYVVDKVLRRGISRKTIGITWDPSHSETEKADPLVEAKRAFALEPINMIHLKGHSYEQEAEIERMAYFGGPAMPGWFADEKSEFYETMIRLGVPIGNNAWSQQYGRVTLPGNVMCKTDIYSLICIARENGFKGRVIAENETPEKNDAVARKEKEDVAKMYENCRDGVKRYLWKGSEYNGVLFKPLNVERNGIFLPSMTWREAERHYGKAD